MICYRDMTFCRYYKDCAKANECHRPLTEEVSKRADEWWGKGEGKAPICMFAEIPNCFEEKEEGKDES